MIINFLIIIQGEDMRKKIVSYFMIIVMILSSVWVTPIKSYGQTEEISSAEYV